MTAAENQIFNDGSSVPDVATSLVQGGLSAGTNDSGGNLDDDPRFSDPTGPDAFRGTRDDDLSPIGASVAVDAGNNSLLPSDRFDLDGDGDTSEPVPIDASGRERVVAGGAAGTRVDLGAYEYGAMDIARERVNGEPVLSFRLDAPYPNPASDDATVIFSAGASNRARLAVYDMLGREVLTAYDQAVSAGSEIKVSIDVRSLPAGLYMVRLTSGLRTLETRLTVAR